ncbi:bromodomain adjacent to zinc finger domain protein 1A isoform X6 [Pieris napi]|uniref:bromodomain adjacent to zinc finger domain protein 1A isoform X6 n=1 Tax=Pieris napi TaxID=78633 RepID=UPI001FB88BF5|nr:bromodomain adjacent to zinc finger domain protein 1A isoform X6 [Pieris napi]
MPLLKRKAFEKSSASGYLRDDDEVFHCEITDEIFKDYEEYCERIILVNSMVWSCEMTGKNNLTYAEALETEKAARKSLRDFPMELRIPILYLATKTNRSSFAEMSEDVFNYVRERYFVGETVEACLEGDNWREAHILSVDSQTQHPDNKTMLPASAYCYEVEQYDESDSSATGQIGTAPYERIRRRKGIYSRDKNRLFLKQFVQMGPVITIKASAIEKYNINKVHFDQIFTGAPPIFPPSKKLLMSPSTSKVQAKPGSASKLKSMKSPQKGRQESMDKFVKKADKSDVSKPKIVNPEARKNAQELAMKMRRAEEQLRQRKEDEKAKKKEKTARVMAYMKEWQKVKDDLELEDHKVLPKGTPVVIEGIEPKHIGDFLSVLDFVHTYAEVLKTKDVFHNELDWDTFRKALTVKDSAGSFSDLIQMFLSAIFSLQEDEAEEYNEKGGIQESTVEKNSEETEMGVNRAIELATRASKWAQTYLGTPLSKLPLDPSTVSEVLRLHLLSSGSAAGSRCVAWRYHQRGGYSSNDDPGLHLRIQRPALLKRLTQKHVADLPMDDKFAILQCLMNQVLSYATVRDIVEDKFEEYKNLKQAYRLLQINERKREPQLATARMELRREAAAKKEEQKLSGDKAKQVDEQMKKDIDKITKESEQKKIEFEKKSKELQMQLFEFTNYLGMDRAFHRYWISRRVGGLFVEAGNEYRGTCRPKPVPLPERTPTDSADLLAYVTELYHSGAKEKEGSDKENESGSNSRGNSPKKPLAHVNGVNIKMSPDSIEQLRDLMVCTADANTCYVHGKSERPQWWVYTNEAQVDALIAALNKRGIREADLKHALEMERNSLIEHLAKSPFAVNGTSKAQTPLQPPSTRRRAIRPSLVVPPECSLEEALELALRDHILELEEKIHHGCLGALKVKDREAWRGTIMLRSYDKQAEFLNWGPNKAFRDDTHLPDGTLRIPNGTEETEIKIPKNKYRDPVYYLETPKSNGIKVEPVEDTKSEVIRGLASALLQVSQGIHHKYIKRPLGLDDKERKDREARNKPCDLDALERWEVSLMESRSIAALTLHLFVIDASVCWAASVLHASCKLCRRRTDPDNMLLCDGCNKGHHLYCLKPQLTSGLSYQKVPDGDWFCEQCKPKEKTPRKRRKLYTEESMEEPGDEDSDEDLSLGVCATCGSGGELGATCVACSNRYHMECAQPPLARAAKRWTCAECLAPPQSRAPAFRRRCAAAAMSSIQQYARNLHKRSYSTDSEDSEFNTALVRLKSKRSRGSKEPSPMANGNNRRSRKSKEDFNGSLTKRGKNSLTNGVHDDSSNRKKRGKHDVKLHTDELQHLLRDALKHKDSWPFFEPVSIDDVPDYLDVITTPMDLNTVKQKLEDGQYTKDEEFLSDVALVFHNCYTYNQETHPVAKAGYRLEKYIIKRCQELNLPPLPESNPDDEDDVPLKRSLPESDETPQAKKARR